MKRIVVFTGAGISSESGLKTFRGEDGLWEGHRIEDVATPEAWVRDPLLVQNFYNMRRTAVRKASPNKAHYSLKHLEEKYDVRIITQNIDDLNERAGSANVLHLHGIITKAQSSQNAELVYELEGKDIETGNCCELGSQLRPHVVWFGEMVPNMREAILLARSADLFLVIGTSLVVYPAANILSYVPVKAKKILIDPNAEDVRVDYAVQKISEKAGVGVPNMVHNLLRSAKDY